MSERSVMVYLMTGFLDRGKTQFLKFTLEQNYFQIDGRTLLLLCEEGEEEYDPMEMLKYGVVIERIEDQEELTAERLEQLTASMNQNVSLWSITACGKSAILRH